MNTPQSTTLVCLGMYWKWIVQALYHTMSFIITLSFNVVYYLLVNVTPFYPVDGLASSTLDPGIHVGSSCSIWVQHDIASTFTIQCNTLTWQLASRHGSLGVVSHNTQCISFSCPQPGRQITAYFRQVHLCVWLVAWSPHQHGPVIITIIDDKNHEVLVWKTYLGSDLCMHM